jgi:hypothetical protein
MRTVSLRDPREWPIELERRVVGQGRLLDHHRVAVLAGLVRSVGDGEGNAWVADDVRVPESRDHPDLADLGSRGSARLGGRGRGGLQRLEARRALFGADRSGGDLVKDFTPQIFHAPN